MHNMVYRTPSKEDTRIRNVIAAPILSASPSHPTARTHNPHMSYFPPWCAFASLGEASPPRELPRLPPLPNCWTGRRPCCTTARRGWFQGGAPERGRREQGRCDGAGRPRKRSGGSGRRKRSSLGACGRSERRWTGAARRGRRRWSEAAASAGSTASSCRRCSYSLANAVNQNQARSEYAEGEGKQSQG